MNTEKLSQAGQIFVALAAVGLASWIVIKAPSKPVANTISIYDRISSNLSFIVSNATNEHSKFVIDNSRIRGGSLTNNLRCYHFSKNDYSLDLIMKNGKLDALSYNGFVQEEKDEVTIIDLADTIGLVEGQDTYLLAADRRVSEVKYDKEAINKRYLRVLEKIEKDSRY